MHDINMLQQKMTGSTALLWICYGLCIASSTILGLADGALSGRTDICVGLIHCATRSMFGITTLTGVFVCQSAAPRPCLWFDIRVLRMTGVTGTLLSTNAQMVA